MASGSGQTGQNGQGRVADVLRSEFGNLLTAAGDRAAASARTKVGALTDRLTDYAEQGGNGSLAAAIKGVQDVAQGKSPARAMLGGGMTALKDKAKKLLGRGQGGQGKKLKVTNIVESIDVGVPVHVAYNQWTRFTDFPSFMKKVESVEQEADEKLRWKAQILWSHRSWESTITHQVPDEKIVWRSEGDKGHVDGAVTFHELAPSLTRVLLTLEYHPQGFFEHTGNLWRAQGRRARLELKHFRRHVMSEVINHPDDVEGWRGTIEDGTTDGRGARRANQDNGEPGGGERRSSSRRGGKAAEKPLARRASAGQGQTSSARASGKNAQANSQTRRRTAAAGGDKAASPVRRRTSSQQQGTRRTAAARSATR